MSIQEDHFSIDIQSMKGNSGFRGLSASKVNVELQEEYSQVQTYDVYFQGKEYKVNNHALGTIDLSDFAHKGFIYQDQGLSLPQWYSLLKDMIRSYKRLVDTAKDNEKAAMAAVYFKYKAKVLDDVFTCSPKMTNTEKNKPLNEKMIGYLAIDPDPHPENKTVLKYQECKSELDQVREVYERLQDSLEIVCNTFEAIRSLGATDRKYIH